MPLALLCPIFCLNMRFKTKSALKADHFALAVEKYWLKEMNAGSNCAHS
jgi:hypothetical protein